MGNILIMCLPLLTQGNFVKPVKCVNVSMIIYDDDILPAPSSSTLVMEKIRPVWPAGKDNYLNQHGEFI